MILYGYKRPNNIYIYCILCVETHYLCRNNFSYALIVCSTEVFPMIYVQNTHQRPLNTMPQASLQSYPPPINVSLVSQYSKANHTAAAPKARCIKDAYGQSMYTQFHAHKLELIKADCVHLMHSSVKPTQLYKSDKRNVYSYFWLCLYAQFLVMTFMDQNPGLLFFFFFCNTDIPQMPFYWPLIEDALTGIYTTQLGGRVIWQLLSAIVLGP